MSTDSDHGDWQEFPEGIHRVSFYGCGFAVEPRRQCNARASVVCGKHTFAAGWCGSARCPSHDPRSPRAARGEPGKP